VAVVETMGFEPINNKTKQVYKISLRPDFQGFAPF
jgi:hypothetical protein